MDFQRVYNKSIERVKPLQKMVVDNLNAQKENIAEKHKYCRGSLMYDLSSPLYWLLRDTSISNDDRQDFTDNILADMKETVFQLLVLLAKPNMLNNMPNCTQEVAADNLVRIKTFLDSLEDIKPLNESLDLVGLYCDEDLQEEIEIENRKPIDIGKANDVINWISHKEEELTENED